METVAIIAVGLFAIMIVAAMVVQVVSRVRTSHKKFIEQKKAVNRMTDDWFKVCYQNCRQTNWKGVSRKLRKAYEAEKELRGIKI